MNIFKRIEESAKAGYMISYETIDQLRNDARGVENGLLPHYTYTAYVIKQEDQDIVYEVSCDHVEDCLIDAVKHVEKDILNRVYESDDESETDELVDALGWVVEQFELYMSKKPACNVVESLSYAKSLLEEHGAMKDGKRTFK